MPEAVQYGRRSAEFARKIGDKNSLAWSLGISAIVLHLMGEFEEASAMRRESLTLAVECRNRWIEAASLVSIRTVPGPETDWDEIWAGWERGMEMFRQGEEVWSQALGEHVASTVHLSLGDTDKARYHADLAKKLWVEAGDIHFASAPTAVLAEISRMTGELDESEAYYTHMIPYWRDIGNYGAIARCLECLAFIARERFERNGRHELAKGKGDPELQQAITYLGAADAIREKYNTPMVAAEVPEWSKEKELLIQLVGDDDFKSAWDQGRQQTLAQVIESLPAEV
jgi:hypothetical protein